MNDQKLHTLLEQLHAEVHKAQIIEERDLALLAELEAELRQLLARKGLPLSAEIQPGDINPSLRRRLEDGLAQFEAAHPTLTQALANVLATLSSGGI
jgi:hypothetical protein